MTEQAANFLPCPSTVVGGELDDGATGLSPFSLSVQTTCGHKTGGKPRQEVPSWSETGHFPLTALQIWEYVTSRVHAAGGLVVQLLS